MYARYLLAAFAIVLLVAGASHRGQIQGRTWLLVGTIFAVVSIWLFLSGS